ncbi:MAG: flagellar filament capping protein FliD, partial [SAR324 cluster bacterium]|nr:flagellar filament capping protein FliD [SAR324 cluster bacterium]
TGVSKGQISITSSCGYLDTAIGGGVMNAAQNAIFDLNGVTGITRENNSVSDVITGLTLSLQGIGSATITVSDDSKTTETKIQEFVDQFNEIVEFINENNQVLRDESGKEVRNIFQPLASVSVDDTALRGFRDALSGIHSGISGTGVNIFADLGITTQRDGTLKFDKAQFEKAVSTSSSSVNSILQQFADLTATTGGTIDSFTRFQGSFDVTINSNKTMIDNMNKQIASAEDSISQQEESLRARFARLEAAIGQMQSQQQALSSILSSIG